MQYQRRLGSEQRDTMWFPYLWAHGRKALVSGWELWKRRAVSPCGPMWLWKRLFHAFFIMCVLLCTLTDLFQDGVCVVLLAVSHECTWWARRTGKSTVGVAQRKCVCVLSWILSGTILSWCRLITERTILSGKWQVWSSLAVLWKPTACGSRIGWVKCKSFWFFKLLAAQLYLIHLLIFKFACCLSALDHEFYTLISYRVMYVF